MAASWRVGAAMRDVPLRQHAGLLEQPAQVEQPAEGAVLAHRLLPRQPHGVGDGGVRPRPPRRRAPRASAGSSSAGSGEPSLRLEDERQRRVAGLHRPALADPAAAAAVEQAQRRCGRPRAGAGRPARRRGSRGRRRARSGRPAWRRGRPAGRGRRRAVVERRRRRSRSRRVMRLAGNSAGSRETSTTRTVGSARCASSQAGPTSARRERAVAVRRRARGASERLDRRRRRGTSRRPGSWRSIQRAERLVAPSARRGRRRGCAPARSGASSAAIGLAVRRPKVAVLAQAAAEVQLEAHHLRAAALGQRALQADVGDLVLGAGVRAAVDVDAHGGVEVAEVRLEVLDDAGRDAAWSRTPRGGRTRCRCRR